MKEQGAAAHGRRLVRFLSENRRRISPLLILAHDYPDPDALASAYALHYLAQQRFRIEARIVYQGAISRAENRAMVKLLRIPAHKLRRGEVARYRHVALVDTQPHFENNPFPPGRRATIVIDQHGSSTPPAADLALVDTRCGATCVILAQALLLAGIDLPRPLATAIAYGILSDTLDLYRAQRRDVIDTYLKVLHEADLTALARIQNPLRPRPFFTTLGRGIQRAASSRKLMVSHLGPVPNPETVSHVADFLLSYERINWSFCTGRYKGHLHLSLRARSPNGRAGEVLRAILDDPNDAGGHGGIAGGRVKVGAGARDDVWRGVERKLRARLADRLRVPGSAEFRRVFDEAPG